MAGRRGALGLLGLALALLSGGGPRGPSAAALQCPAAANPAVAGLPSTYGEFQGYWVPDQASGHLFLVVIDVDNQDGSASIRCEPGELQDQADISPDDGERRLCHTATASRADVTESERDHMMVLNASQSWDGSTMEMVNGTIFLTWYDNGSPSPEEAPLRLRRKNQVCLGEPAGAGLGDFCQFPFVRQGKVHYTCAMEEDNTLWCPTRVDPNTLEANASHWQRCSCEVDMRVYSIATGSPDNFLFDQWAADVFKSYIEDTFNLPLVYVGYKDCGEHADLAVGAPASCAPDRGDRSTIGRGIGYVQERGLYFYHHRGQEGVQWWEGNGTFFDIYKTHQDLDTVVNTFQPLPFHGLDRAGAQGCELEPADEGPETPNWCNDDARYTPPHCENQQCAELYHIDARGGLDGAGGMVEALINTYQLPYTVLYLGAARHLQFLSLPGTPWPWSRPPGYPYVAFGSSPSLQAHTHRIQFPVNEHDCSLPWDGSPDTERRCDFLAPPRYKLIDDDFQARFPAIAKTFKEYEVSNIMMIEMHGVATEVAPWSWWSSKVTPAEATCEIIRRHGSLFDGFRGNCMEPDQPVLDDQCKCFPGQLRLDDGSCGPCPANMFCLGVAHERESFPCSGTASHAEAVRTQPDSRGPSAPEDCRCMPGFGSTSDVWMQPRELWPFVNPAKDSSLEVCGPCPEGMYKQTTSFETCSEQCPSLSWGPPGSPSQSNCECLQGNFPITRDPLVCLQCPHEGLLCGSGQPVAKAGYYRTDVAKYGWTNQSLVGETLEKIPVRICPIMIACKENNTCMEGTTGKDCSRCQHGWVRSSSLDRVCEKCPDQMRAWIDRVVVGLIIDVVMIYFSSVMVQNAVDHPAQLSVLIKVWFHHAFLLVPLLGLPDWVSWMSPFSNAVQRFKLERRCAGFEMGFETPPAQALFMAASLIVHVLQALVLSLVIYVVLSCWNRKAIRITRERVSYIAEVLDMCDSSEDLHLRSPQRMDLIKCEFDLYIKDVIRKKRILGVWRAVRDPRSKVSWIRGFIQDSRTMFLFYFILCYSLVVKELIMALAWWPLFSDDREPDEVVLVFGSTLEYMGTVHTQMAIPIVILLLLYGVGFPVFCILKVRRLRHNMVLTKEEYSSAWGYLYHGFELDSPAIYWEVVLMIQRLILAVVLEAGVLPKEMDMRIFRCVAVVFLVLQTWQQPQEKSKARAIVWIVGVSYLLCAVVADCQVLMLTSDYKYIVNILTGQDNSAAKAAAQEQGRSVEELYVDSIMVMIELVVIFLLNLYWWYSVAKLLLEDAVMLVLVKLKRLDAEGYRADSHSVSDDGDDLDFESSNPSRKLSLDQVGSSLLAQQANFFAHVGKGSPWWRYCGLVGLFRWMAWRAYARTRSRVHIIVGSQIRMKASNKAIDDNEAYTECVIHDTYSLLQTWLQSHCRTADQAGKLKRGGSEGSIGSLDSSWLSSDSRLSSDDAGPAGYTPKAGAGKGQRRCCSFCRRRKTRQVQEEREYLTTVLVDAVEAFLVDHRINFLPNNIIDFIFLEAVYCIKQGRASEEKARSTVFKFVWTHPSGQVEALNELFEGGPGRPHLSMEMRGRSLHELMEKHAANEGTDSLTVPELERYVQQLRCTDTRVVRESLREFCSDNIAKQTTVRAGYDRACQTRFFASKGLQSGGRADQGVATEDVVVDSDINPEVREMGEELDELQRDSAQVLEELAEAKLEVQRLRERRLGGGAERKRAEALDVQLR